MAFGCSENTCKILEPVAHLVEQVFSNRGFALWAECFEQGTVAAEAGVDAGHISFLLRAVLVVVGIAAVGIAEFLV